MTRLVILHYHLFKNAGTSLDRILKANFADRWVTREFAAAGHDNSSEVAEWIATTPEAVAFSSHTALGPLPCIAGVRIVPVMLLRDPVERIRSAYWFERHQDIDTFATRLARSHDLAGYVRGRLARPRDRQCRNFQTYRLATMQPGPEPEIARAIAAAHMIRAVGVLGRVEAFAAALDRLEKILRPAFPQFSWTETRANASPRTDQPEDPELVELLEARNRDDRALLAALWPEPRSAAGGL